MVSIEKMNELLKAKQEYEKEQKELLENGKFHCNVCNKILDVEERRGRRLTCKVCYRKKDKIYRRNTRARLRKEGKI